MLRIGTVLVVLGATFCSGWTAYAQGPGFRGGRGPDDNFFADRNTFHFLLEHHDAIRREVKELPDGVETLTETDDKELVARLQEHVEAMYERVEKTQPIRMRDPLFAEIFRHTKAINMQLEHTAKGVRVTETSEDPYVAKLIKAHAVVVSAFVKNGFAEAHKNHAVPGDEEQDLHEADAEAGRDANHDGGHAHEGHGPAECAPAEIFVQFDKVYIPALALSNQGKKEASRQALDRLSKLWDERFVAEFQEMFVGDTEWARAMSGIAQAIAVAEIQLQADQLPAAHETLEPIREILLEARTRQGVAYSLDALSRFHATMEEIVRPAMTMELTDEVSEARVAELQQIVNRAADEWAAVEKTTFDPQLHQLDDGQVAQIAELVKKERRAIVKLSAALKHGESAAIIASSRQLKPPFAKLYMTFGDFK